MSLRCECERHQDAESGEQRHHGGAAVADQGQRHAHHGHNAAHHAGVHEHVDEERERDRPSGETCKRVLALHREVQGPADHHRVEGQDEELAEQAEFLADDGEDEIGRAFRQELELCLAAVHVALAEDSARANRDLRLDDVIAGAQRVGLRVQEGQDALALIVVDHVPGAPCGAAEERDGYQDDPKVHAGEQHHDEAGGRDQQRGSQVGLHHDHGGRNHDEHAHDQQVEECRRQRDARACTRRTSWAPQAS